MAGMNGALGPDARPFEGPPVPDRKLSLSSFSLLGLGGWPRSRPAARESLPPVLVIEGEPDPSLREVIEQAAERLGAAVSFVDDLRSLARDPDLDAVLGVILTRPRSPGLLPEAVREAGRLVRGRPVLAVAARPLSPAAGSLP